MKRRTSALTAAALSLLVLGSPLIAGCSDPWVTTRVLESSLMSGRSDFHLISHYISAIYKQLTGDDQRAIADWSKAIEINPQYVNAYIMRGAARSELKDYQIAIAP